MRKFIIAFIVAGLLSLATVVPAFADIDGPPPNVPGCEISDAARNGHGVGEIIGDDPGPGGPPGPDPDPIPDHCFPHP